MDQNQNNQPSLVERIQATPESAAATDAAISAKQKEEYEVELSVVDSHDEKSTHMVCSNEMTVQEEEIIPVDHKLIVNDFIQSEDEVIYVKNDHENSTMPKRFFGMRQKLEDVKKSWF